MKTCSLFFLAMALSTAQASAIKAYFNHNSNAQYVEPYRNITREGDNLEAVILQQIYSAKKSVYVAVQELRLPLVARALIDKKNQGVDVRVILEHDYNFTINAPRDPHNDNEHEASKLVELQAFVDLNKNGKLEESELATRDAIYMLNAAQVPIIDDTSDGSAGSGLMHHKFIVVDGKSILAGSANFTMSCVHGDTLAPGSRGNANSVVVFQSTDAGKIFTEEFLQMWGNGKRGNFGQRKTYRGPQVVNVGSTKVTIQFSPTPRRLPWDESVNGLIATTLKRASSSIKSTLFVFSDQGIATAMETRHSSGVSVGVLVEPKFAYRDYSELLTLQGLEVPGANCKLKPNNVPWKIPAQVTGMPILPQGDVVHHKFGLVDDQIVVVGSENWSDSANYTNDETLLVIEDRAISDSYAQEYERMKAKSVLGTPKSVLDEIHKREQACHHKGQYF